MRNTLGWTSNRKQFSDDSNAKGVIHQPILHVEDGKNQWTEIFQTENTKNSQRVFRFQQVLISFTSTQRALDSHGPWEYRPYCAPMISNRADTMFSIFYHNKSHKRDYSHCHGWNLQPTMVGKSTCWLSQESLLKNSNRTFRMEGCPNKSKFHSQF